MCVNVIRQTSKPHAKQTLNNTRDMKCVEENCSQLSI